MRRSKRLTGLVLLLGVLSVGCGGEGSGRANIGANSSATLAPSSSAAPASEAAAPAVSVPAEGVSPIASLSDSSSSTATSSGFSAQGQNLPVTATLAHQCVVPGTTQSITITTAPNSAVGYHAIYSDGKQGFDKGYYGGNNSGLTDATGNFSESWVIAPNAPAGQVTVDVIALRQDGASGKTQLLFSMSGVGGCR
jgi:hypothetical protein